MSVTGRERMWEERQSYPDAVWQGVWVREERVARVRLGRRWRRGLCGAVLRVRAHLWRLLEHGRDHLLERLRPRSVGGGLREVAQADPGFLGLLKVRSRAKSTGKELGTLPVALHVVLLVVRLVALRAAAVGAPDRVGHAELRARLGEARAGVHGQQVVDDQRACALLPRGDGMQVVRMLMCGRSEDGPGDYRLCLFGGLRSVRRRHCGVGALERERVRGTLGRALVGLCLSHQQVWGRGGHGLRWEDGNRHYTPLQDTQMSLRVSVPTRSEPSSTPRDRD